MVRHAMDVSIAAMTAVTTSTESNETLQCSMTTTAVVVISTLQGGGGVISHHYAQTLSYIDQEVLNIDLAMLGKVSSSYCIYEELYGTCSSHHHNDTGIDCS
jgi:hypothetical protein